MRFSQRHFYFVEVRNWLIYMGIDAPDALVRHIRRAVETLLTPYQRDLFFHASPFDVARDLAGRR